MLLTNVKMRYTASNSGHTVACRDVTKYAVLCKQIKGTDKAQYLTT